MAILLNQRSRADQGEILAAFAARLRGIEGLGDRNVVVSGDPVPVMFPPGRMCVCVAPSEGVFDAKKWNGGSHATATENGGVTIGFYQTIRRDPTGRSEEALLSDDSWTEWKRRILAKLTVLDPSLRHVSPQWEPMRLVEGTQDLIPMLRNPPIPKHCTSVLDVDGHPGWKGFQILFSCEWDWDLYA